MGKTRNKSSGAGPVGGYNFQAAVSAIAYAHMLRGTPVFWTKGYSGSMPIKVDSETSGPGDDISLELADGKHVEIQAKKGLKADEKFWIAINSLCEGINSNRCDFGMLIVCPFSSRTISRDYARAIKRIGHGRLDLISKQQEKITQYLINCEYDPTDICSRLRIHTVSAVDEHGDAIAAAHAELGHICTKKSHIPLVWNVLYEEALKAIEYKSSRNYSALASVLSSLNLKYDIGSDETPVALSESLLEWIESTTAEFTVPGISDPLSTDNAWLELHASVGDNSVDQSIPIEDALKSYHKPESESSLGSSEVIDAKTIGTFRKLCVVTGGPGSGKSLLTKVLAREFGREGLVSLQIRLRDLANKIHYTGCAVEEGLLSLGLDGAGVSPADFRSICLPNVVLLCDGLDESGHYQSTIAEGLCRISKSKPSYRIIVTTRPIGYFANELKHWRHYYIMPLKSENTKNHLRKLCSGVNAKVSKDGNELQAIIDSNFEKIEGFKTIFTNPLLCVFAAALVLNGYKIGKSKIDLYTRVFKMIDENPDPRKSDVAKVPRSIRNKVLNHLGWLATTSPLTTSQETESLCAEQIALVTSNPDEDTEKAILYWENAGIIERLRHGGHELIAFTHKSCGEFAGARFLETIETADARHLIESAIDNSEWEEILDFASQTSVATLIAESAIDKTRSGEPTRHLSNRALQALVRSKSNIDPTKITSFLDRIFAAVISEDRQNAYTIGLCLIENDLSKLNEVVEHAKKLRNGTPDWSKLIGWSILVCHFRDELDPVELEKVIYYYITREKDNNVFMNPVYNPSVTKSVNWIFKEAPDKRVFEYFLSSALDITLENLSEAKQNELVSAVLRLRNLASHNFIFRLKDLLSKIGRSDLLSDLLAGYFTDYDVGNLRFNSFYAGNQVLFHEVLVGAFLNVDLSTPPTTGMKHLGALLQLAYIMKIPADDAFVWEDVSEYSQVQELLRKAAEVFGLSLERLAQEVRGFNQYNRNVDAFDETLRVIVAIPKVDPCEVDWDRAQSVEFDNKSLEELLSHPSQWVAILAANLLNERLTDTDKLHVCKRTFQNGQGRTLYIAAEFICQLPNGIGHNLIVTTLKSPQKLGTQYLYEKLAEDKFPVVHSHRDIVISGLFSSSVNIATSTAKWCCTSMSNSNGWLLELLRKAFNHWSVNEQPYPKKGGTVPESPRDILCETLIHHGVWGFNELIELTKDARPNVSKNAMQELIKRSYESEEARDRLVAKTSEKRLSPFQCLQLMDADIPYSQEHLTKLCGLLDDIDPEYRKIAIQILSHPNMEKPLAVSLAIQRKDDENGDVRDAALRFLGSY